MTFPVRSPARGISRSRVNRACRPRICADRPSPSEKVEATGQKRRAMMRIMTRRVFVQMGAIGILYSELFSAQTRRPHARDLGLAPGVFPPGPLNVIIDVTGVRVGQATLIQGDDVRTGVNAIMPAPKYSAKIFATPWASL